MKRPLLLVVLSLLLFPSTALAGGFLLYEHGASATGMADARTAISDDVNALYYNPAAITELTGVQIQAGATGIFPFINYDAANDAPTRTWINMDAGESYDVNDGQNDEEISAFFPPVHLYASWQIPDVGVSVGFALNNPFGLGTEWPDDWDGRFIAIQTEIQTFFMQPVVAIDIAKMAGFKDSFKLSVAGGYNFVYGTAKLSKGIDLRATEAMAPGIVGADGVHPEGKMDMTGDAMGHGWNIALFAELPDLIAFGASFRSQVSMDFEGDANFTFNDAGERARLTPIVSLPDSTTGAVTIDLPMNMNFGVAFLGVEDLKIAVDFFYAFFRSYDELDVQFACVDDPTNPCGSLDLEPLEKGWDDAWQVSVGAEYDVWQGLMARVGYGFVASPVPDTHYDPSLPDGPRHLICAGTGYGGDWWKLDLGYMLAMWEGEKDNEVGGADGPTPNGMANGHYKTVTHLIALSFSTMF